MESFAIYLIKVNIALIVLYAFYKLSFSKDTFFRLRRIMLLLICVTSLIYPLIDFSGWTDEYAIGETFTTVTINCYRKCWLLQLYPLLQQKLK